MVFDPTFKQRNILARQQYKILEKAKKDGREMTARQALEIARNQQRSVGNVDTKSLYLTDLWKSYSQLSSEERAMMRRARETWRPISHYMYENWRAVLRPEFRKINQKR